MAAVTYPVRPAPRSLDDVRDPDIGAIHLYPRHALRGLETALCLFAARWHGRQDAYWLAEAGLRTTCVDLDGDRLREMMAVYPDDWAFRQMDAWDFANTTPVGYDVVSLDPFTFDFDRCHADLGLWCSLARHAVIMGCEIDTEIVAPAAWQEVNRVFRSHYAEGVEWVVLQPKGVGITADKVTACLITRGDVDLQPIIDTLPYDEVLVWDARERDEQPGTFGRYELMREAKHDVVYVQDDDCVFRDHQRLMAAYNPGTITAVYGHGETPDGYDDMALIHGGALFDREAALEAFDQYLEHWPKDNGFYREADMIHGTLVPHRHIHLPYEIRMDIATDPSRMCNQPWQRDLKLEITNRARAVRDT